jgi:hypothetical protein
VGLLSLSGSDVKHQSNGCARKRIPVEEEEEEEEEEEGYRSEPLTC